MLAHYKCDTRITVTCDRCAGVEGERFLIGQSDGTTGYRGEPATSLSAPPQFR